MERKEIRKHIISNTLHIVLILVLILGISWVGISSLRSDNYLINICGVLFMSLSFVITTLYFYFFFSKLKDRNKKEE